MECDDAIGVGDSGCALVVDARMPPDALAIMQPKCVEPYLRYVAATCALRDAELALRKAQEEYGQALRELNAAIAPLPGTGQTEQQSP